MTKNRLEAFSDGVIAIIITIMVLELKVPHGADLAALRAAVAGVPRRYVLSFVYLGIYWNNHHHMLHAADRVNGAILWANLHLLFWLSLFPFATGWMGENHFAPLPTAVYGVVLLMAAIAYYILQRAIMRRQGPGRVLRRGDRPRPQRQALAGRSTCVGDPAGVRGRWIAHGALRARGLDLARPRPADRAGARLKPSQPPRAPSTPS